MQVKELVKLLLQKNQELDIAIEVKFPSKYEIGGNWYLFEIMELDCGWETSNLLTIYGNDPELVYPDRVKRATNYFT